ncbi:MAG TPA: amino acid racemase [Pyrinomonadaceae bacterium]|nr:amino acid racemase [Pyrinomonadaceae bacterium]
MRTLGLIGGVGPESTVDYYRQLVSGFREKAGGTYPPVIINSVDLKRLLDWMAENRLDLVADYLAQEIQKLERAGADFVALASNTPHIVFDDLQRRTKLPLLSIVEATARRVKQLGMTSVGLFGTRYTMQARFYPDTFVRQGLTLVLPDTNEQAFIHEKYLGELLNDQFLPETRAAMLEIAGRLQKEQSIEGLILGGTELPLLLRDEQYNGLRMLDTTKIHVAELIDQMLA